MNTIPASIPAGPRYNAPDTATAAYVPPPAPSPAVSAVAAYVPPAAPAAAPAPVEVAYAPPSNTDAAFDPPPGWRPNSDTAAYVPPPAARPSAIAQRDVPLPAEPVEVAAMPEPPRPSSFTPRVQSASAYEPIAPQPHRDSFRLVSPALAAPVPAFRESPGQWAIQVGAFGNEGLAHIAVGQAREQAGSVLASAHPFVAGVREPHGTLYRARLTGLSRESASQACERLKSRTNCIVLSPAAQS